jgi:16S rRNA (guanine966-N2)-methyltransferase
MRITGGAFRSRLLTTPRGDETRPTSDRVREALFSILSARMSLDGARVLDLYAGTGALGLEALSRGAAHVTFVERRREAIAAIKANVLALDVAAQVRLVARTVEAAAAELSGVLDVVFADPPYADVQSGAATRALDRMLAAISLAPGGTLVLEHSSKTAPPAFSGLGTPHDTRVYGDTAISLYLAGPCRSPHLRSK